MITDQHEPRRAPTDDANQRPAPTVWPAAARPAKSATLRKRRIRQWLVSTLYLLPLLIALLMFVYYPIIKGLLVSFQSTDLVNADWIGLSNYRDIFNDPRFGHAWRNTLAFTGLNIVLGYLLPLFLALMIKELGRGRSFFQFAMYLPVMLPPVVTALLWRYLLDPTEVGLLNAILGNFGISPQPWLQSTGQALPTIVVISSWAGFGFWALVYLAALQGIRPELYEAAELDGASLRQRVRYVVIPQIAPVIQVAILLGFIDEMQIFNEPFVLTDGGPQDSTITVVLLIYQYAFKFGDFGAAAALGMMLLLFLLACSLFAAWATRRVSRG